MWCVIKCGDEYYSHTEMFNWIHTTPDIDEAAHYNPHDATLEKKEIESYLDFKNIEVTIVEIKEEANK
jgi:hypothetical protein